MTAVVSQISHFFTHVKLEEIGPIGKMFVCHFRLKPMTQPMIYFGWVR